MQITAKELKEVLDKHLKWLQEGGSKPDLSEADLRRANLHEANLRGANLRGADLRRANLHEANLRWANLRGANLRWANLRGANLRWADLRWANLRGAELSGANLREAELSGANLSEANLSEAKLSDYQIIPEADSFTGWKKLQNDVICKLEIPAEAKRTCSLVGRKCRAEFVRVLEGDGQSIDPSGEGQVLEYRVGKIVRADSFDDDIRVECSHGIHFFVTRKEAEEFT